MQRENCFLNPKKIIRKYIENRKLENRYDKFFIRLQKTLAD